MSKKINTDRFRAMAEKLRSDAEDKLRPRDTHTAKKLAQARSAERDGLKYRRAASLIEAFCVTAEMEDLPPELAGEKLTKDSFLTAAALSGKHVSNGYHSYAIDSNTHSDNSTVSVALRKLADELKTDSDRSSDIATQSRLQIARAVDGLRGCDIAGFFPTPEPLINQMIQLADIRNDHRILEPSAGMGSIVERIIATGARDVMSLEINSSLCAILDIKGIKHHCGDFLEHRGVYDRILMNPPFERKQAIRHIEHAFTLLAEGGRIVAILPTNHASELDLPLMTVHRLPSNAFNTSDAFRRTGVSVAMVEIRKSIKSANRSAPSSRFSFLRDLPQVLAANASRGAS